ncbi:MAG: hypothetical protein WBA34_06500 [Candidatus Deferrimicrobiaceae bacterium]
MIVTTGAATRWYGHMDSARLLRKLNLQNNAELTRVAIQNRVVEL